MKADVSGMGRLVSKNVRLTIREIEAINSLIKSGEYATFSEFVREAIRRLLAEKEGRVR